MFGPMGMAVGPVIMPSKATTHTARPKKSIVSEQSSVVDSASYASSKVDVKSQEESRPTSSELEMNAESNIPFVDDMMTQTNLLVLPPTNPSFQMAHFLKTTGPANEPPVKSTRSKRISSAMRIFKNSSRRPPETLTAAHQRLNEVIAEEPLVCEKPRKSETKDHTEAKLPETVVPKVSKTGNKYFEIESGPSNTANSKEAPGPSSEILDSNVSVFVTDQLSTDSLHDWVLSFEALQEFSVPQASSKETSRGRKSRRASVHFPDEETIRILDGKTVTPVRPLFLGSKACLEAPEENKNTRVVREKKAPLRSHPIDSGPAPTTTRTISPEEVADQTETTQLAHPRPRRIYSNPSLLQRASSDVTSVRFSRFLQDGTRSISDSPGPPPPRSPLRVSMHPDSLDKMLNTSTKMKDNEAEPSRLRDDQAIHVTKEAAVTYLPREKGDFDLPSCLRPGSSTTTSTATSDVFCSHAPRSKNGSSKPHELIDAMAKASQQNTSRRRLRRGRPEGPRPLDLDINSAQDSQDRREESEAHCTSPLSMKHTVSMGDVSENYRIIATTASPSPRVSHVRRPAVSKGRRSPAPRPKTAKRGRSMKSVTSTPSRAGSPKKTRQATTPDLPSPPPKKDLPPTPSEKYQRFSRSNISEASVEATTVMMARASSIKALPSLPIDSRGQPMFFPSPPSSAKKTMTRMQPFEQSSLNLETRMEELERRNRLLEAALMAVLKTGGKMNGCPCHEDSQECPDATRDGSLVTSGSVRSRGSSMCSGPSALDMYLTTRGK